MEIEDLVEEVEIIELVPQSIELPNNVLFKIFEFVSVATRRNARLVCKQWLNVCNDLRFRNNEAFFFNASYTFLAIVKIITDSGREIVNLKLQSYVIDAESKCLWETLGSKISSLKLTSCQFVEGMLGHIIFSCPNMTEFGVYGGSFNSGPFPFGGMFLCTKFKHPEEQTLRREKLERLDFDAASMPIIYPDLERIYTYFPNLKSLSINLCTEEPLEKQKDLTHFKILLELLSKETSKIDTLFIDFHDDEHHMFKDLPVMKLKCMTDAGCNLSKLEDVGMRFAQCTFNDDSLKTILHFKFWTSLEITLHRIAQEKFNKFLINFLKECPSLTSLATYWKISKDTQFYAVFPALVKSHLKILSLDIDDRSMPDSQADYLETRAKDHLKNLIKNDTVCHLTVNSSEASFSSVFIENFPKVRHLKFSYGSAEDAFKFLPNLLSIQVGDKVGCTYQYSNSPRTPVTNLQYMSIPIFSFDDFPKIKFPDLKFLSLKLTSDEMFVMKKSGDLDEYYEEDDDTDSFVEKIASILSSVTLNAPNLRGLCFDCPDLNDYYLKCETGNCSRDVLGAFFKSCQNLHQVRYIGTKISSQIDEKFCKQRITECYKELPSLRALYCTTQKQSLASFFNILENKVEFNEAVSRKRSMFNQVHVDLDLMDYWVEHR